MAKTTDAEIKTASEAAPVSGSIKDILDAMEKVHVRIPLPEGLTREEASRMPKPPNIPVCINGYTYQIRKGEDVMVPKVVADVLRQANLI